MRILTTALLTAFLLPCHASAFELILSFEGNPIFEENSFTQSMYDLDGDVFPEIVYETGAGSDQILSTMKLDGSHIWDFSLDKALVCPSCSEEWSWRLYSFGDVDQVLGREAVLIWSDYLTELHGTAIVSPGLGGAMIHNFTGGYPYGLSDFDGDGRDELVIRYSGDPLDHVEIWGQGLGVAVPEESEGGYRSERMELLPSYPNPAYRGTTLAFNLGSPGRVQIGIADIRGRKVREIGPLLLEAGNNAISWDGLDGEGRLVASGVYLCTIRSAGGSESSKMVHIR